MAKRSTRPATNIASFAELDAAGFGLGYRPTSYEDAAEQPSNDQKPQQRGAIRAAADTGLEVASGAVKGIKFMSDVFGADNAVSTALDDVSKFAKSLQSAQAQGEDARMAQIMKEAEDKGIWGQVKAAASAASEAPIRQSIGAVATGIPMIAASMVPGMREASWGTRLATMGGLGAAQGVGMVKSSMRDAVYQRAIEEGRSPQEAAALADQAQSYQENPGQIALGGLMGGAATATGFAPAMVRALSPVGANAAKTMSIPTIGKALGMGVVKEVPMEAAQGGQEQLAGNVAQNSAGFATPLGRGVAGSAAMEGMLAAPGGAVGGAFDYRSDRADFQAQQSEAEAAAKAQAAADAKAQAAAAAQAEADAAAAAIRANMQPGNGPLTNAANAGTEADAQKVEEAGASTAAAIASAPDLADTTSSITLPEGSAEFINPDFQARQQTLAEQMASPENREKVRARFGDDGLNQVPYYAQAAGRADIPAKTADNMLQVAERMMGEVLLQPLGGDAQLGGMVRDPLTLDAPEVAGAQPLGLGLDQTPSGRFTVDAQGNAVPETAVQRGDAQRRAGEMAGLGSQKTDILNPSGQPFKTKFAASLAAKKTPGEVVEVPGGYAVRAEQATPATKEKQAQPPAQQPILNNGKPFTLAEVGKANQSIGGTAVSVPGGWAIQPPQAAQKPAATPATAMPTAATPAASAQSAILGRNSQPIAEGGQPFATREEAKAEKRMQPLMRVAPAEGGGFILKPASERKLAAVEKAAKRLKYPSTGETGPRSLHGFILQIGGLASGTMPDVGFDLNPRVGNRRLFSPRGKTIEQAAMAAKQEGYIQDEDENTLIEALKRSLNVSPVYTPDGYEAMAEAQMQARYEDFLAAEQDGGAENDWSRLTPEELADTGYNDYDEATQAEIRALVAQAEALGIDAESILEDVAQRTENATQKDYENAAKSAIEAAIRSSEESRSRDLGQAGAEAGPATADTPAAPAAVTGPASDIRARNLAALKERMLGQKKPTPTTPPAPNKATPAPEAGPTNQGAENGQGQETLLKAEQPTGAAAMVSGAPVAEQPSDTTKPESVTQKLLGHAKRLGILVNETTGRISASNGTVNIPPEDREVDGAISRDHVISHELGHAAMQKRQINYAGFPAKALREQVKNWDDLVSASKAHRPDVWAHKNKKISDHARKPNEVIADAIASVLIGNSDFSLLRDIPLTMRDIGLEDTDTTKPGGAIEKIRKAAQSKVDAAPVQQPSGSIDGIVIKPGKGLIKGKFKAEVDGVGLPGDAFNTEQEAYDAALKYREVLAKRANEGAEAQRRKDAIAESFRNGDQVTNAQIESLGLKSDFSDMRWFMSTAADMFVLNSRQIRPIVKNLIKVRRSDMGTEYEYVPTRKALEAIAASQSLTSPTKADIESQQARAEQAAKAKAAQDKADAARAAKERERKDVAAASVAAADTFELGQDAMANLTGQNDLQFSRAAAKEVRDLVTLHNLSEENLMYAGKMGGIPVPSIGITKVETPFGGFGGITLIAQKDLIDPESGVPVYDRDAWTARFPKLNFKKVKAKVADAFYERMQSVRDFGSDGGQFMSMLFEELRNSNVQAPDKITSLFTRYTAPKMLYAQEVLGKTIKPPMRDIKSETPFGHAKSWRDFVAKNYKAGMTEQQEKEFNRLAAVAARAAMAEINTENKARVDERTARMLDSSMNGYLDRYISENYGMNAGILDRAVRDVKSFGKKEVDPMKLDEAVRKVVPTDDAGYNKWIANLVEPLFEAPTITLRGAEVPVTLDNIVDAMTIGKTAGAEKSMTFGAGKAASMLGKQFKSIDEIKAARDRVVSAASESEGKKSTEALISEYQNHVSEFYTGKDWKGNIDTWAALDSSLEALTKAGRTPTDASMNIALQRAGFKRVDAKGISLAKQALEALRDASTNYFEAKPQRAVRLNEFKGAVVPKGTSAEAIALLEENGITVEVHGNAEGAREKAIQKLAKKLDGKTGNVIFSRDTESPRTPASTIRAAITKAYGNLLDKLEAKGLVTIAQTEREAIEAAAQARADKTGGDVEQIKRSMLASVQMQRVWHGSPHRGIQQFSTDKIGTGEGAQAYGWGLYYASKQEIAEDYRKKLSGGADQSPRRFFMGQEFQPGTGGYFAARIVESSTLAKARKDVSEWIKDAETWSDRRKADKGEQETLRVWIDALAILKQAYSKSDFTKKSAQGQLYEVEIPEDGDMLLWDKPLSEQPENVQKALSEIDPDTYSPDGDDYDSSEPGMMTYQRLKAMLGSDRAASMRLLDAGAKGIKYLDGTSRNAGDGSYNYVIFDGADTQIVDVKYSANGNIEGFFDKQTGKSFLVADNLTAASAPGTLMHEVGIHMAADGKLEPLFKRAGSILKTGSGNAFIQRVKARMARAGETSDEEAAAYIVTEYENDRAKAPITIGKWLADLTAAVRAWLFSKGIILKAEQLTVADIAAVARANSRSMARGWPNGGPGGGQSFSRSDMPATIEVDGKTRSTMNSNGQPIHPTLDGVRNFWKWFADSRVVDEQGRPLVVYHGTTTTDGIFKFNTFAHFGTMRAANDRLQKTGGDAQSIQPVYLNLRNMLDVKDNLTLETPRDYAMQATLSGEIGRQEYRSLSDVSFDSDAVASLLESKGFDGLRYTNQYEDIGSESFVAFNPTQIKSATGNTGAFSPTDSDIRFSRGGGIADSVQQGAFSVKNATADQLAHYRGMGMQALGRRQIVDLYGDMLPELKQYDKLVQRMDADENESGADADKLVNEWAKLDERSTIGIGAAKQPGMERKLAELMHDATLAQIDPEKPLQAGDNADKHKELAARFAALTPKAQEVYRTARDMYAAHFKKVQAELQARIQRSGMDEKSKAKMIAKMDADLFGKLKGVYFPLARFGKYVVVSKNAAGETVSVSRAETLAEANNMRREVVKNSPAGITVSRVYKDAEFNATRDAAGKGFMSDLMTMLQGQGVSADVLDSVGQLYLSSLPDLSWAKHGIHRKGTPGFSQDARRAFAQHMFHGSRHLAKVRYSDQLADTLLNMEQRVKDQRDDEAFDQIKAQQVVDEMNKRHELLMNPKTNALSTAMTSVGFVWFLGLSPASALVNLSQTALVAYPVMASKWGFQKAGAALLSASAEVVRAGNDLSKVLAGEELAAFQKAVDHGTIDVTQAHDLAGVAQGEDERVAMAMRPVMRAASFMFHHAEKFNRQATFIAAYRLAKENGAGAESAFEQATKATYDGHFDYAASNRARIMQGNWQKVLFLFKQYGQNMVYTLMRQAYLSMNGMTDRQKAEARKQLGGLLTMHAMAAGALGLPIVGVLLSAASMLGSDDDDPWDAEVALKNTLADNFGPKAAEVMAHGLSRLTPWDLSGRVALNKLILPDIQEGLEGTPLWEKMLSAAAGPVAGIGGGIAKGMAEMGQGQYMRGLESMMPVALKNPIKAMRYAEEGAVDKTGVVIKDEVSLSGVAGQFSGFRPSDVALATEGRTAIYQANKALTDRRANIVRMYAQARMTDDAEGVQEVLKMVQSFNEKNPTRRITMPQLMQSVRGRTQRIEQAQQGVYLPKTQRDVVDAGRFAVLD